MTVESLETGRHSYRGLVTCASVWACPVCASKISEKRRKELRERVDRWIEQGGTVLLLTMTIRHSRQDRLADLRVKLTRARRSMVSGRWAQKIKERFGIAGRVKALEVTHGENGWHPHIHELLFIEPGQEIDLEELRAELLDRWQCAVVAAGLGSVTDVGIDIRRGDGAIAEYLDKQAWSGVEEVTKQVSKIGRKGGRTPFELLAAREFEGDIQAGERFQEYARAMKGARQLVWSHGLRKRLGLDAEQTDEEIAAECDHPTVDKLPIDGPDWDSVAAMKMGAQVLIRLNEGDLQGAKDLISACVIRDEQRHGRLLRDVLSRPGRGSPSVFLA